MTCKTQADVDARLSKLAAVEVRKCRECDGNGQVFALDYAQQAGESTDCSRCNGTGREPCGGCARRFPILGVVGRPGVGRPPFGIPWSVAEGFRPQAEGNHGQTLERLAQRSGLSASEAVEAHHGRGLRRLLRAETDEYAAREEIQALSCTPCHGTGFADPRVLVTTWAPGGPEACDWFKKRLDDVDVVIAAAGCSEWSVEVLTNVCKSAGVRFVDRREK